MFAFSIASPLSFSTSPRTSLSNQKTVFRTANRVVRASMDGVATATTSYNVENDVRDELKAMDAYTPIVPYEVLAERLGREISDIVKLDANENPYGPSPAAKKALAEAPFLHIYPDPESGSLREALSSYTGVPSEHLLVGAGADELIDLIFRLLVIPGAGHTVINFPPTFGMYRFDADVNGAEVINITRNTADFSVNIETVERHFATVSPLKRPRIIFVASPNNPDGSVLPDEVLTRLLKLPTLVVLDEAYAEFASNKRIQWVLKHDNLVVLRTFSKWAGLAGLRVGYGAFPLNIMKHMWKIKQPYNVNVAGQIAAESSIRDKEDLLAKVDKMIMARKRFYEEIKRFPWLKPYSSESNFVLCRVGGGRAAAEVKTKLAERGVLVRYYTSKGLSDCVRFSMGTEQQMARLYDALAEL